MVRYAPTTGEIEVSGSRETLVQLADLLAAAPGRLAADETADPGTYGQCLAEIVVRSSADTKAVIGVNTDTRTLVLDGSRAALKLLGDNVRALAVEGAPGDNLHVEYFPEHFYLDESSLATVFALIT
ncbi:hypothetical protein KUTG_08140 [Kutzneria sp. 744]|nr:hypothetical protein KUTG_08140 [Kutzneria sp. 744]